MNWKVISIVVIIILVLVYTCIFFFYNEKEISDFKKYTKQLNDVKFDSEKVIYALGEATHGNKEFQELKLEIFKKVVQENEVRAFCLEGDFGGITFTNEYIQGKNDITLDEAVDKLDFKIYKTEEMKKLIKWMREYNEKSSIEDKVRIYGFDMQSFEYNIDKLKKIYSTIDSSQKNILLNEFYNLYENKDDYGKISIESLYNKREQVINDIITDIENYRGTTNNKLLSKKNIECDYAIQHAKCLLQGAKLASVTNVDYSRVRDEFMSSNIEWIIEMEKKNGRDKIMISGHNGHVAKVASNYCFMGSILNEKYGDKYFAIGTDFYNTKCNINSSQGRKIFSVCSLDPLAYQVKELEKNEYYLDFGEASESTELQGYINNPMFMGSLGEGFEWYLKFLPISYRVNQVPADNYDAMIFIYEATPFNLLENK